MKLYKHQIKTLIHGLRTGSYADLSDLGTGKTISTLAVFSKTLETNTRFRGVVLAPKSVIFSAWIRDAENFPNIRAVAVTGSAQQKLTAFNSPGNLFVTNYETMLQKFDFVGAKFDMLICDEAVRLKNPRAISVKRIIALAHHIPQKVIITGLPTPNTLLEIWSQFHVMKPGILGKSFWAFRSRYFFQDPFSYGGHKWLPKTGAEKSVMEIIKPYVVRHEKNKCLDLPGKVHQIRDIELSAKQFKYYREMLKNMVAEIEKAEITAANKATVISKLTQICSGFIYADGGETVFFDNAKLEELKDLLSGDLANEQVFVLYNFRAEAELFKQEFPDAAYIEGGQNDQERETAINDFKAGRKRLLFASIKAAKYGLTFTNTAYTIYYSLNYSLDDFYQSQDRTHRIGQNRTVNYIYLLTKGTVERRIYKSLMAKRNLNEAFFEIIRGEI